MSPDHASDHKVLDLCSFGVGNIHREAFSFEASIESREVQIQLDGFVGGVGVHDETPIDSLDDWCEDG